MKKYTLFSFVFILSLILLGSFGVKSANAMTAIVPGCKTGDLYSRTTGQSCTVTPVIKDCAVGDIYSSLTGLPCPTTTTTTVTPVINSLSPSSGPVGTQVVISGTGLSSIENSATVVFGNILITGVSTKGNSMTFTVPSKDNCNLNGTICPALAVGAYRVTVVTSNGTSNGLYFTVTSATLPVGCTSTSTYSVITGIVCRGPIPITPITPITTATSNYSNSAYGVSFNYPSTWTEKLGTSAVNNCSPGQMGDYGLSIPSNTTSLVTVEVPANTYPNTSFDGGYLNLSVNQQLSASQCLALNPQNNSTPSQGTTTIDGVVFNWTAMGSAAAGTDFNSYNYSGYTNGNCYEFSLGDMESGGAIGENGITAVGNAIWSDLKNVLNSTTFTTSTTTPTSATITVASPNGGEQWAQGTTQTISWKDSSPVPMYMCPISFSTSTSTCNSYSPKYDILFSQPSTTGVQTFGYIATAVSGSSYSWTIPSWSTLGSYVIKVCKTGTDVCGVSNSFNIISGTTTFSPVTVVSPNGGETFVQGNNYTISFSGGTAPMQAGLVKGTATASSLAGIKSSGLIGWIANMTGTPTTPTSKFSWDGTQTCDLTMTVCTPVTPGSYKLILVAPNKDGNNCFGDSTCNFDVSDAPFSIVSGTTTSSTIPQVQNLKATLMAGDPPIVSLSWSPVTIASNQGVPTEYAIYRSMTSGFTPSSSNLIGWSNGSTTYNDEGMVSGTLGGANVATGTYYYVVAAGDWKNNLGPVSTQVSATVGGLTPTITSPIVKPVAPIITRVTQSL